jgi:hypothetical protein
VKFRKNLALALLLILLAVLTGCATGGSSSRGSLTKATGDAAGKEESKGRGEGRTRTRNDTQARTQQNENNEEYYVEEDSDGGGFLIGLLVSLFTKDNKEEEYDPYDYLTYSNPDNTSGEYETWTDADEFGLSPEGEGGDGGGDGGGGLDIQRSNLNFWFSPSTLGGDAIQGFTTYTLMYSAYTGRRYRAHAGLYYGRGKKGSQPNIQERIRWISEAGIDLGTRGYFTSDRSQLGFYMILGLRAGVTSWSYVNAVEAPNSDGTTESISSDGLWTFVPYVGLGSSLLQTKKVHLGLNFTVGGRLYTNRTIEDYENDLLKDVPEYKLNFEASFFF